MKKWVIGALLAATAGMPAMALAQDAGNGDLRDRRAAAREARAARGEQPSAERQAQRAERQERRAERMAVAQPTVQVQPSAEAQVRRNGMRGDVNAGARMDGGFRQQRQRDMFAGQAQAQADAQLAAERQRNEQQRQARVQRDGRNTDGIVRLDRRNPSYDPARGDRPDFGNDRRDDRADRRDGRQDGRARSNRDGYNTGWNGRDGWNGGNDRSGWNDRSRNDRNWNRDWRQDGRFDWNRNRLNNRNAYRLPRYYAPYGWNNGYRRFSIGVSLSSVLWGQNYWINDPFSYRLPEAYGPYRWVRYYGDALLIDIRSGQVVDVVHDIFY
ncbi:MAG: hypothetical protein JWN21_1001 [Sphingomonas bacterium]|uniref:RcnB family protein n=1 Tax=Sphingomonas bacterium TaxID=1895847 RepID=UPI00260AD5DF|nr:RcnB family protein [Sphingomonas bacterium]MDB5695458.1 hypothetical protein [Sphingomonas bacterium]